MTIAGSDSSGGAGIQADLKAFAARGVHGTCAITAVTAQNPSRVDAIQCVSADLVGQQIRSVADGMMINAAKTGMLGNREIIETVSATLKSIPAMSLIVDPVMVATSGAQLLSDDGIGVMKSHLFPLAELITPNLYEAALLLGGEVADDKAAMERQALALHDLFGSPVLVKGGHLVNAQGVSDEAADVLADSGAVQWLSAPVVDAADTHGTGCTLSAAIAAERASGRPLMTAVQRAKTYLTGALEQTRKD